MDITGIEKDVKEYRPKKKDSKSAAHFADNYNVSPAASSKLMAGEGLSDGVEALDSGIMMSTAEIIDFGEGTDSWTNTH